MALNFERLTSKISQGNERLNCQITTKNLNSLKVGYWRTKKAVQYATYVAGNPRKLQVVTASLVHNP